jgi:hypothetical protein
MSIFFNLLKKKSYELSTTTKRENEVHRGLEIHPKTHE